MKNNNKEKLRKTKITIGTIGLASSVAFGIAAPLVINAQKENSRVNAIANNAVLQGTVADADLGVQQRKNNEAPKFIYNLDSINPAQLKPVANNEMIINEYLVRVLTGLKVYHLDRVPGLIEKYIAAMKDIFFQLTNPAMSNDPTITAAAIEGLKLYTDRTTINDIYNKINNFGNQLLATEKMSIIKPTQIRDTTSVDFVGTNGAYTINNQYLLKADDFAYKVADIDLTKLKDQGSLGFTFKDNSVADAANHDYRIIISNENNEISNFITKGSKDINDLIKNNDIFVRDMNATAEAPNAAAAKNQTPKDFNDKVKFVLDSTGKKLSVMVLPSDDNIDEAKKIEFGIDATISGREAIKNTTLKYGFLDNSLSPLWTKEWNSVADKFYTSHDAPVGTKLVPSSATQTSPTLKVFSGKSKWNGNEQIGTETYNWLRLFMGQGTKISHQLQFAGKDGSDAFEDQKNILTLEYQNGPIIISPRNQNFVITSTAASAATGISLVDSKFYIRSDEATIPGSTENYAKLDLALSKGVISFNAKQDKTEEDYVISSPVSKLFFEDPFGQQTPTIASKQTVPISTKPKTNVTNKNIELIADVLRNWAGFEVPNSSSKSYIMSEAELAKLGPTVPGWKYGANGYSIYDEAIDTSDEMKKFVYQYQHIYVDAQQRIISDPQKQFGLFKTDSNLNFELDAQGNQIPVEATGTEIYKHFLEYTRSLTKWSIDKLGLDDTYGIGKIDRYLLAKPGEAMGIVQTRYIDVAGIEGQELKDVADMLVRLWVGDGLTNFETDIKDKVEKEFGSFLPGWEQMIAGKGKAPQGSTLDETTPEYQMSKQYIYSIIQPYFTRMLNKILEIETSKFETNLKLSLKTGFESFLNDTDSKIKVNDNLIATLQTTGQDVSNLHLVSLGSYGTATATNGKESLKSLISFIYNAGLQTRFLKDADIQIFDKYAANGAVLLDDPTIFDQDKQPEFVKLMQAISTVMDKTFTNGQQYVSFEQIVEKIQGHQYDKTAGTSPEKDLSETIKFAIETIATDKTFSSLSILGTSTDITYLESLVMGKNLHVIFSEYLAKLDQSKTDDIRAIKEFLEQQKQYDTKSLTNLAISLGNYNLDFFVKSLTETSRVESTAREMLKQDLAKQIAVEIDSDNQLVNFLSNPDNLVKYAFIGIGAGAAAIGGSIFGLSFRKSVRTSRKNLILERAVFIGIATLGIALALFGIIPGLL